MAPPISNAEQCRGPVPQMRWRWFAVVLLAMTLVPAYLLWRSIDGYTSLRAGYYCHAASWFATAARGGDHAAQNVLGTLYYHGLGVEQDYGQAKYWYAKAADAGNTKAQINMGLMYRQGFGGNLDLPRAYGWFNLARKNGNPRGQLYMSDTLAETPLNGNTVPDIMRRYGSLEDLQRE